MICPWCNTVNSEEVAFCKSCGRLLPEPEIIDEEPEDIIKEDVKENPETTESLEKTETSATNEEIVEKSEITELVKIQEKEVITNESELIRNAQTVISTLSDNLEKQKRISGIFLALTILFSLSTIVTGILAYNYYTDWSDFYDIQSKCDSLQSKYDSLTNRFNSLTDSYNTLKKEYKELENNSISQERYSSLEKKYNALLENGVSVRLTKIYNGADKSTHLDHSKITYLYFDYTVSMSKNVKASDKLFIKVLNPDGSLKEAVNNPTGYTTSRSLDSSCWGFGLEKPGTYTTGYYIIEFWYNDNCVGGKRFYIY